MKYKRVEDEGTLRGKLHKFNIHSIRKKGDRFAGYLKILTGVEPQVGRKNISNQKKHSSVQGKRGSRHDAPLPQVRDEIFDREEKLFRSLEKAVRQLVKNVHWYLQHTQVDVLHQKRQASFIFDRHSD